MSNPSDSTDRHDLQVPDEDRQFTRLPRGLFRIMAEGRISKSDFIVAGAMQFGGGMSRRCYMSNETLAEITGFSLATIKTSIAHLHAAGLIVRVGKRGKTIEWALVWMGKYLDDERTPGQKLATSTSGQILATTRTRTRAHARCGQNLASACGQNLVSACGQNLATTKSPFGGVDNSPDGGVSREASPAEESSACGGGPPPPTPPPAPPKGEEKTSIQSRQPSRLFPFERPEWLSDPEILEWSKSPETIATWGKVCSKIEEGERRLAWAMTQLGIAKGEEQSELTLAGRAREAVDLYFDLIGMLDGVLITPVGCSPTWDEDVIRRDRLARIMAIEETRNAYKAKMEENRPTPPPNGPKGGGMVNPPSQGNGSLLERPRAIPKQAPPPENPAAMIQEECEPGSRVSHPDYGLGTVQDYDPASDKGSILFDRMSGQPKLFIFSKSKLKFLGMMPSPPPLSRLKTPEECEAERERQLAALKDRSNNHETRSMQP